MKITGELLKTERLKQNLTVQDVAFSLKLSSKIIQAIESGSQEELPAKTFVRGFVKSYAQLLKLDATLVMRQFQEEMGSTQPLPKTPPPMGESAQKNEPPHLTKKQNLQSNTLSVDSNKKTLGYIFLAGLLVVLIVITNKIADRYQKETIVDIKTASNMRPIEASTLPANGLASVGPTAISTSADAATVIAAPSPISASAAEDAAQTTSPTANLSNVVSIPEEGFEPSLGKAIEIIVEAKKDTELSFAKGNSSAFSKLKLLSKQFQVIRSTGGLHLKTEDGGAINLIVNGVEKGAAGASNKPVKLTF